MMDNSHMHREDSNARLNSNNSLRPSGANSSGGCTYDDGKSNEESGHLFGVHPTSQDVWDQGVGYLKNLATSSVPEAKLAHNQQPGSVAPWKVGPNISVASECHRLFSSASDITASQDQLQMIFMHPGSRAPDKNAFQPNLHPFLSETTKTQHYNALYIDHLPSELLTCSRGNQFDLDKINSQKTNQSNGVKLQAVKKQNFDEIYRLLDKGVHMNSTEDECTALQASAAAGDAAAIEHLLACRADPGKRDHYERTAEYYSNPKGVSFTTLMPTSNSRTRILAPTTIEWEKSYRGESTNAYFTDVQQPMQTLPQGHQGKHFLPTIETPLLERNRITCDYSSSLSRPKVKEGESNKSYPESKKAHLKRESSTLPRILSSEKKTSTQRAKRPRKSETDKKPHGWEHQGFSSTDPEKDDSRDEDFSCPATVNIHSWSDRPSSLRSCSSGQLTLTDSFNDSIFECDVSSLQSKAKKLGPLKRSGSSKSGKVGPGMRRKQKRSRKLSSDSASSSACREKSSNILSDLKDNRKRLKRGKLSLNCGERTNLTKKKQQKVKRKKKALKFHSFEENDVKKHCEQSRNKDKIKGTQIEQNRNALVTTDNKQDRKKKKKIKKEKPNDSEATNQTVPIFSTLKSNDYPIARGKRDSANIPEPSPKLVCPLIELYTGKSAERSSTLTGMNIGEPLISSTGVNVTGVENALFGHDLTACEARVLHDAYVRQDPLMNRTRTLEHSVEGNVPSASSDKCSDKKSFPIQYGKKGKEKGKKKCGRRPKSQLLQTVSCASVPSHLLRKKDEVLRLSDGKAKKCMRHHNKDKRNNKGSKAIGNKLNYSNNAKTGRPSGPIKKKKMRAMSCKNTKPIKPTDKKLETPIFLHSGRATATKSPKFFNTPSKSFHYHGSSRSSTPLSLVKEGGTPHILPPNVKKLTANSAIGETRLHKAARHGYLENIEYYLEMGFEVNTKTNAGYTALHEACVRGRLEAAKRLLQYGADVNVHSNDGTRPIHDAVEHDHVEMTRLLLACGADPMLTKFCGRSIQNMVHSEEMATFISALIKELKPVDENSKDDPDRLWTFEASAVLDKKLKLGCDNLNFPPLDDNQFSHMDLELYETPPPDTYFVQPSDTSNRTNYCLLSDVLKMKKCSRADFLLKHPVDIKTMPLKEFHLQFSNNWVPKVCGGCPDVSGKYVELITANKSVAEATLLRVTDEGEVLTLQTDRALKKPRQVSHRSFIEELLTSNSSKNCMESMANLVDIAHCSNSSFRPITCGNSLCEKKSPLTAEETSASIRSPYKREITADISYHVDTKTLQDSFNKNTDSVKFTENFIVNDTITSNHIASAGLLLPSEKLNLHERDDISDKRSSCSDETAELHTTRERVLLREEHDSKSTSPVSKTEKAIFRFAEPGVIRNGEIFNNGRVKSDCKETKSCKKITMRNNESFSLLKNISDKVRQQQKYNCVAEMADGDRAIL